MPAMQPMNVLDLFSGIGGISLGLERTGGFRTVAFCEIDQFCKLVLEKHWPGVPIWGDIRELSADSIPRVDIIVGGFPCQPHSVAGKRKGQSDKRHLWPEFARLVRTIRPLWVLAENVPGIRTTAADEVIGDLEAEGYTVWPLVVGADDVGAPHRRKRVWFVAHQRSERLEGSRSGTVNMEPAYTESSGCGENRWPSRPREPQHEWEEPRLDYSKGRNRHDVRRVRSQGNAEGDGIGAESGGAELPLGSSTHGLSLRLVRRANREALKAYGNSVVPQVVEVIGRAILDFESEYSQCS